MGKTKKYLVGVDYGTTGTKTNIFDLKGNVVGTAYFDTPTQFPQPGRAEQDAKEIIENLFASTKAAVESSGIDPEEIGGISFTHMCCSFVPVDREGNFLYPIILWADTRGADMFDYIRTKWKENGITEQDDYDFTGYPLGPLCTMPKVLWLKKNHPDIYEKTYKFIGLQALMVSAYCGNQTYMDDKPGIIYSKLCDGRTFEWDDRRFAMYRLDKDKYPERVDPGTYAGTVPKSVAEKTGLAEGTPIYTGSGDQRCAPVGAGVIKDGMASAILGTGGVVHAYSSTPIRHPEGKISIMGHAGTGHWQVEGSCSSAASSFRWWRDELGQAEAREAKESGKNVYDILTSEAAKSPAGSNGLIFNAWFQGADCPRYDVNARATFTGLSFAHTKADMIRSVLEGVCYEMKSMLDVAEVALGKKIETVRAMGGGAKSALWLQMQADIYNVRLETVENEETTSLAAAMFAGIGCGIFGSLEEAVDKMVRITGHLDPIPENVKIYGELYPLYQKIYESLSKEVFPVIKQFQDKHSAK